jgi:DNA-binding beta-propeller fold protein YncE
MLASAAVTAAALLLSAPEARGGGQVEIFVTVSVTNNTPTTLTLTDADRGDASGTFWSDSQGNEIGPPTLGSQLQPGATAGFYIAGSAALLPDIEGSVEYEDQDPSTGFNGSGVKVNFHDPPFTSNTAGADPIGWYTTSGFSYNQHGDLAVSAPIVATDICPGSGTGPCAYSSDHFIGSSGTGPGQFQRPWSVAVDSRPVVYVSDLDNDNIQVFNPSGNYLTGWGSAGSGQGQFLDPNGVAAQPGAIGPSSGLVAVTDLGNNRVETFTPFGQFTAAWGGGLGAIRSLTVDSGGNVYVVDGASGAIVKFGPTGAFITSFRTNDFQVPWDAAIDPSTGNVAVLDSQADRVFRFTSAGAFVDSFPVTAAPEGVAVDQAGNTYVTDGDAATVTKYAKTGAEVVRWGAPGSAAGELNGPRGVAVDSSNNVYVADTENDRVQVFALAASQLLIRGAPRLAAGRATTAKGRGGRAVVARVRCRARRGTSCRGALTVGTARRFVARRPVTMRARRSRVVRLRLDRLGRRLARRRPSALSLIAHTRQWSGDTRVTQRRPLR